RNRDDQQDKDEPFESRDNLGRRGGTNGHRVSVALLRRVLRAVRPFFFYFRFRKRLNILNIVHCLTRPSMPMLKRFFSPSYFFGGQRRVRGTVLSHSSRAVRERAAFGGEFVGTTHGNVVIFFHMR